MRAVRSECELYLHKHFMGVKVFRIARKSVLATELSELAGPVGQYHRAALIREGSVRGAIGIVKAPSEEPAARDLIISRSIETKRPLEPGSDTGRAANGQTYCQ